MERPPYGVCFPCRVRRVVDGDTLEVSLNHSERLWTIRLLDCWAAERNTPEGRSATRAVQAIVSEGSEFAVFVPEPDDPLRILTATSLGRWLGHIWLKLHGKDVNLSELLVRRGLATEEKQKQ